MKIKSVRGDVVFLCNDFGDSSPIYWKGKTIQQVVSGVKAAETIAVATGINDAIYFAEFLFEIYNGSPYKREQEAGSLPVDMYTDSKTLFDSVKSSKQIDEKTFRIKIAEMKQSLQTGKLRSLNHVVTKNMLADCLTKSGANPGRLLSVLREGRQKELDVKFSLKYKSS